MPGERVLLAHKEPMFRLGTRLILEREGFEVVADLGDDLELIQIVERTPPQILVMGEVLDGGSAFDVATQLRAKGFALKMLLLREGSTVLALRDIVEAGFLGCVESSQDANVLIRTVHEVLGGAAVYWCPSSGDDGTRVRVELSRREREVLRLVAGGLSKKAIASNLGVSIRTVEAHRTSIMAKLDIHSIAGLVRFAVRSGIVEP